MVRSGKARTRVAMHGDGVRVVRRVGGRQALLVRRRLLVDFGFLLGKLVLHVVEGGVRAVHRIAGAVRFELVLERRHGLVAGPGPFDGHGGDGLFGKGRVELVAEIVHFAFVEGELIVVLVVGRAREMLADRAEGLGERRVVRRQRLVVGEAADEARVDRGHRLDRSSPVDLRVLIERLQVVFGKVLVEVIKGKDIRERARVRRQRSVLDEETFDEFVSREQREGRSQQRNEEE